MHTCALIAILVFGAIFAVIALFWRDAPRKENTIQQKTHFSIHRDYPIANELSEMVNSSELIVVGRYTGFDSIWNMARNPGNIYEEDTERYVEGHLYSFEIDEILKGNTEKDEILINHKYSELIKTTESNAVINEQGIIISEATEINEISFTLTNKLYIEPEIGATYILFLLYDGNFDDYYGAVEPFIIKVSDEIVYLQSNLLDSEGEVEEEVMIDGTDRTMVVSQYGDHIDDQLSGTDFGSVKDTIRSGQ
jgi:hypothetical protein